MLTKPTYVIGFDGAGLEASAMVKTMMQVDAVHVTANWSTNENAPVDVLIYDIAHRQSDGQPYYKVRLCGVPDNERAELTLSKPFRLMQFVELVNDAEAIFERHTSASEAPNHEQMAAPSMAQAAQSVAEPVHEPVAQPMEIVEQPAVPVREETRTGNWLEFVSDYRNQYLQKETRGFLLLNIESCHVATADLSKKQYHRASNFGKMINQNNHLNWTMRLNPEEDEFPLGATVLPIGNLLWIAGLMAGNGKNVPWLSPDKAYLLKQWPNFSILNHNMKMIEMAAKMTKRPMRASELAAETEAGLGQVWNFLNAASLLGSFSQAEAPALAFRATRPVAEDGKLEGVSSLISKLKKHLTKVA